MLGRRALMTSSRINYGNWLGNYSDVSLLLRGNGTLGSTLVPIDESPTPKTITAVGDAGISTAQFKYGGSSLSFDGTGDYFTLDSSNDFAFGTGDFTIEFWMRSLNVGGSFSAQKGIFQISNEAGGLSNDYSGGILMYQGRGPSVGTDGAITLLVSGAFVGSVAVLTLNGWNHVVLVRTGSTFRVFVDTNLVITLTSSAALTASNLVVGGRSSASHLYHGFLDDFRITKGLARYGVGTGVNANKLVIAGTNEAFVSTVQLPASLIDDLNYENVSLLLRGNGTLGSTLVPIDESPTPKTITAVGDAGISTTVAKWNQGSGGSSLSFDGSVDHVRLNGEADFAFGTGDFTIEFWVYFNNLSTYSVLYDSRPSGTPGAYPMIWRTNDNRIRYYVSNADRIIGPTVAQNTWIHIAVCRSGTSTRLFVNGVQGGSTYTDSTNYLNGASRPMIGINGGNFLADPFNGFIDDLRVTKGVARYVSNFTPPPAELPNF